MCEKECLALVQSLLVHGRLTQARCLQLNPVMLQRFNNKPDLGAYDPEFRFNIFR
jgi:hypothetical protein